jgi:predicted AAA+ superfamily ATPase
VHDRWQTDFRNHFAGELSATGELRAWSIPVGDAASEQGGFFSWGSASVELLKQSGETLPGGTAYLELAPFDTLEVESKQMDNLWLRGGFPRSFLADNDRDSFRWRQDFIRPIWTPTSPNQ